MPRSPKTTRETPWRRPGRWSAPAIDGHRAVLAAGGARLLLDFLDDGVVRVRCALEGEPLSDHSWAVVERKPAGGSLTLAVGEAEWTVAGPGASVRIDRRSGALAFGTGGDGTPPFLRTKPRGGVASSGPRRRLAFEYPDGEMTFGFGEKSGRMDKRGFVLRMWNTDSFLYDRLTDPLYMSIPFWTGLRDGRAHGVFVDDTWPLVADAGARERDTLEITAAGGSIDWYVIPGPEPKRVIERFTRLTGRPCLPPLWALGFQICRYSYFPEARVRELAAQLRSRRIPCDVIYLDIHYMDRFRSFTWDRERFPDPAKLLDDLHAQGFRVVAIVDPGLAVEPGHPPYDSGLEGGHFVVTPEGAVATGRVWPGVCAFPDFTRAATRTWWGDLYAGLVDAGLDGFWNDMNEPSVFGGPGGTLPAETRHRSDAGPAPHQALHNVYGQAMVQGTREGLERLRPGRRPFVLTRAGYAGVQRFAAGWSGDNLSSWEDFKLSIPMALNMAASGQPLFGPDLGGFGGAPSPELYTRWLQAGAFLGLMRVHSCFGTPDQEPWSFGPEWEERNRAAIETRYRLLPYLYSLFHEAARTGVPPVRPLWMEWPDAGALARRDDVFLLGSSLLVAPVLEPGQVFRRVPLPPGRWFTFPDGRPLPPKREVTLEAPLDRIPVLARAGAIIPWGEPAQHAGELRRDVLRVLVFAGEGGVLTFHDDAGDGPAAGGPVHTTWMRVTSTPISTVLDVACGGDAVAPSFDEILFEVLGLAGPPHSVTSSGGRAVADASEAAGEGGWEWDGGQNVLELRVLAAELPARIEIAAGPRLVERPVLDVPRDRELEAAEDQAAIVLHPTDHLVAVEWWEPKRLAAVILATWGPAGLLVAAEVEDSEPAPPPFNAHDDGLYLAVRPVGGGPETLRRFHVAMPEEGGRCLAQKDRQWAPETESAASVQRDGRSVSWSVLLPAAALGLAALTGGLLLDFDVAVQLSDSRRRRGVIEWVQGFTAPDEPGGRLRLGP